MPPDTSERARDAFAQDRTGALRLVIAGLAILSAATLLLLQWAPWGEDFRPLWTGGRVASAQSGRLYDFDYVTALQGWPFGEGALRPFPYAPATLLLFSPLSRLPYGAAITLWSLASVAVLAWGSRRAGLPWWTLLVPSVAFALFCGQTTPIVLGLALAAFSDRSGGIIRGVLIGLATVLKPQLLIFAPLALAAERRWDSLAAAAGTGLALFGLSMAIWGIDPWKDWVGALGRFQTEVFLRNPELLADAMTPYATLTRAGLPGSWAYALAPFGAWLVWRAFAQGRDAADRAAALFAAALLITPYALNYEAALLAPAAAAAIARTRERRWPAYAALAGLHVASLSWSWVSLATGLGLILAAPARGRLASRGYP